MFKKVLLAGAAGLLLAACENGDVNINANDNSVNTDNSVSGGGGVFYAGINGQEDAYEQTLHSLDFVYSWFPSENWTLKFRAQNILNEETEIDQTSSAGDEVRILEQTVGTNFLLDIRYEL